MAAHRAITSHFSDLIREVSGSVEFIADKCKEQFIITGESTYSEVIDSNKMKDAKAKSLVSAVSDRIKTQGGDVDPDNSIFKKFVDILYMDPSLGDIAKKLEDTLAGMLPRIQCTDVSDSGTTHFPIVDTGSGDTASSPSLQVIGLTTQRRPLSQEIRQENRDLKRILAEKDDQIKRYEDSLQKIKHEREEAVFKLTESQKQYKILEEQKDGETTALKGNIESLMNELSGLKAKLADEQKLNKDKVEECEQEIKSLKSQLQQKEEKYGKEITELNKQICVLTVKVKDREISEQKLKTQIAEAKQEASEAKLELSEQKHAEKDNEIAEKDTEIAEKDNEIEKLKKDLEGLSFKKRTN